MGKNETEPDWPWIVAMMYEENHICGGNLSEFPYITSNICS